MRGVHRVALSLYYNCDEVLASFHSFVPFRGSTYSTVLLCCNNTVIRINERRVNDHDVWKWLPAATSIEIKQNNY